MDESLLVLSAAIARVSLTSEFPKGIPTDQLENAQYAAIDLCTVILNYVAIAIKILKSEWPTFERADTSEHSLDGFPREQRPCSQASEHVYHRVQQR
jgi:hypothetical protein